MAALEIAEAAIAETVALIEADGGSAVALVADITNEADIARAVQSAVSEFGGLDLLFANAGIMPHADRSVLAGDPAWG